MYNSEVLIRILQNIDNSVFNSLCVQILRNTISPQVKQVTPTYGGQDAGRDAVLFGECTTDYNADRGIDYWIFQFRQYKTSNREKCFRQFKNECRETLKRFSKCRAYIFITSVTYSGAHKTGLFDKVNKEKRILAEEFNVIVDFWDGMEICNHIHGNPRKYSHFLPHSHYFRLHDPDPRLFREKEISVKSPIISLLEDNDSILPESVLYNLFPPAGNVIGPESESKEIWRLLQRGDLAKARNILIRIIENVRNKRVQYFYSNLYFRSLLWSKLLIAYIDCLQGQIRSAEVFLSEVEGPITKIGESELMAWFYNIKSIIFGKLSNESAALLCSDKAISVAKNNHLYWLEVLISLRKLHRANWNAWENGQKPETELFNNVIDEITKNINKMGYDEKIHASAIKMAVKTLHISWSKEKAEEAQALATSTIQKLTEFNMDFSEIARMSGEIGRVLSRSLNRPTEAIEYYKTSLKYLCYSRSLARLRYFLTWMAELYIENGEDLIGAVFLHTALRIHKILYNDVDTDHKLVERIQALSPKEIAVKNDLKDLIRTNKHLLLLENHTNVEEGWWHSILQQKNSIS